MAFTEVQAPVSLLLNRGLTTSAKLIWLVSRLSGPCGPAVLQSRSCLSRPTILKGLSELTAAGWYDQTGPLEPAPAGASLLLPGDLLMDGKLAAQARLLYGVLRLTAAFRESKGKTTYAELSQLTGCGLKSMRSAMRCLTIARWLKVDQKHQQAPIQFELLNPVYARSKADFAKMRSRLIKGKYGGETLMRAYLSLLIESDQFQDNANPGFLVNPLTGELLQFDRFYPPGVAFEFNGPQHDGPTERFPDLEDFKQLRARDLMKAGACLERGVKLVIVRGPDLSLTGMQQKVGHLLPLRDLQGKERLIEHLENKSRRYRQSAG